MCYTLFVFINNLSKYFCMAVTKTKTTSARTRKAIASPVPEGPVGGMGMMEDPACGHSNCGRACNVRHVGPTSPIRDHHIAHIARGVSNVWTASIVAGLAVVLTGAIAYSAVQAAPVERSSSQASTSAGFAKLNTRLDDLNSRLDDLETRLKALNDQCDVTAKDAGSELGNGSTNDASSTDSGSTN